MGVRNLEEVGMGRARTAALTAGGVVVLLGLGAGYVAANVNDMVPGPFTTQAAWEEPSPFPTVSLPPSQPAGQVLPGPDAAAPLPTAQALAEKVEQLRASAAVGDSTGISVVDVLTGEVLAGADAEAGHVPASTTKMLTAAAVSATLDLTDTLRTTTALAGSDQLYLIGGGDMTLSLESGNPDSVLGRAGLGDLAQETADALASRGIASVELHLDDTLVASDGLAEGWPENYLWNGWVTPIQALAVDLGRVEGQTQRSTDPAMRAAHQFAEALTARGIEVRTGPVRTQLPADAVELAAVESAPLQELFDYTLAESENTLTELFGRLVAHAVGEPTTFKGATTAILATLANLGIDVNGTVLVDASGLSDVNRIPPRLLTDLLVAADSDPALREFARALPVSGLEGTLADRWIEAGVVRAKTGTLVGVVSLAGYLPTADGRLLAFAVMADGAPYGGSYGARLEIDTWVNSLLECGC